MDCSVYCDLLSESKVNPMLAASLPCELRRIPADKFIDAYTSHAIKLSLIDCSIIVTIHLENSINYCLIKYK
ncbi:hypothetical protein Mucpa_6564 [Mucilaginibacter paludis DSM 18603]|uniref:Uncharacterized protein n=1 Tax=Mucilaginibacter paludis DSM 18603 TaxID=714943 RepID=H1YB90_9SPHI|nr:hypothetical protein Mucpa_6564 [Mucilaginibacter paludis DSM 18603]